MNPVCRWACMAFSPGPEPPQKKQLPGTQSRLIIATYFWGLITFSEISLSEVKK